MTGDDYQQNQVELNWKIQLENSKNWTKYVKHNAASYNISMERGAFAT